MELYIAIIAFIGITVYYFYNYWVPGEPIKKSKLLAFALVASNLLYVFIYLPPPDPTWTNIWWFPTFYLWTEVAAYSMILLPNDTEVGATKALTTYTAWFMMLLFFSIGMLDALF
ncbi:hypothetical protein [Zooshikella sp. RANM57]|uniref:hypothetical protein n=1 Tax=Zooshikella sp. RANM57 TaxID=3425863 RepID=UPI003D6FB829